MTRRLATYVLFDPHTGAIAQAGTGVAFPRSGLLVAEILGDLDFRQLVNGKFHVDISNITERGDEPRIATLIEN
jgi:hypothetical protein